MSLGWPHRELERVFSNMRRLERAIDQQEPLAALLYASLATQALGDVARVLVERARDNGEPWRIIGEAVGKSPQSIARLFR